MDIDSVKQQLLNESVALEEFGGDVQLVEISAVTGKGLEELEDCLLLQV